jgi:hypothetical protein
MEMSRKLPGELRFPAPQIVLEDDRIYSGDNGRLFCGKHAGSSARYTGRDISGYRVILLRESEKAELRKSFGVRHLCESCRSEADKATSGKGTSGMHCFKKPREEMCEDCRQYEERYERAWKKAVASGDIDPNAQTIICSDLWDEKGLIE